MKKNHKKQKVRARHYSKLHGKTRSRKKKSNILYDDPYFHGIGLENVFENIKYIKNPNE